MSPFDSHQHWRVQGNVIFRTVPTSESYFQFTVASRHLENDGWRRISSRWPLDSPSSPMSTPPSGKPLPVWVSHLRKLRMTKDLNRANPQESKPVKTSRRWCILRPCNCFRYAAASWKMVAGDEFVLYGSWPVLGNSKSSKNYADRRRMHNIDTSALSHHEIPNFPVFPFPDQTSVD